MTLVSVFEHQPISLIGEDVPFRQTHLRQLERLNLQAGVEIVRLGYRQLRATSYVGVIQLGNVTLQILPKVDATGVNDARHSASVEKAAANLLWMLVYAGELPIHENEVTSLIKRRGNLFEILVRVFCERLSKQLVTGFHRTYRQRRELLPVLKGRWLFSEQLCKQPLLRERFLVVYDEFSKDNPLNRVFCYVIHFLWGLTQDPGNRRQLDILRMWFDQVTLLPNISPQDLARVTFTRLNEAYRPIFNLACIFLGQESLYLRAGRIQTFSFLLDMNVLFERFVVGFLRRHRQQALPERLKRCEIIAQGVGEPRWLASTEPSGGEKKFRLKPDILFRSPDGSITLVVDTKYKVHSEIQQADAFQMHAYSKRYKCPDVLLMYPESQTASQMTSQTLYIESSEGVFPIRLRTQTIGLCYDLQLPNERDELAKEMALALGGT